MTPWNMILFLGDHSINHLFEDLISKFKTFSETHTWDHQRNEKEKEAVHHLLAERVKKVQLQKLIWYHESKQSLVCNMAQQTPIADRQQCQEVLF